MSIKIHGLHNITVYHSIVKCIKERICLTVRVVHNDQGRLNRGCKGCTAPGRQRIRGAKNLKAFYFILFHIILTK